MIKQTLHHKIIFILVLSVCATVPLTNDIFISGIPEMTRYFLGDDISLVLSASLLGLAIAQIFYGPLLDRFGRKPVLLGGLLLYILASAYVMLAQYFIPLIIGRFLQALGVCSAIVSVLAIVRDTYKKEELIKATGLIMAILGVGPAAAPLIGSFLNHLWGWRASFIFLFLLGLFYFLWILFFMDFIFS
jgi:DHA1 family bicyclomycin/chloramphenicol resistance-like MFS transporter